MSGKEGKFIGDQKYLLDRREGIVSKYKNLTVGKVSFLSLLKYELITTLFSGVPGALGLFLRKIFFPGLFKKTGKGVVFGKHMTIRHPKKIEIGNGVIFDDHSVLDAKGDGNRGIVMGNNILVGRNTIISCKGGDIDIGDFSNIGPNNTLISETSLKIGKYVFTAGHSYLIAGGNHSFEKKDQPIWFQPSLSKGGISIEDDIWIGAQSTILDGVTIGSGTVIGAGSLVIKPIPPLSVAAGAPAKVIKKR